MTKPHLMQSPDDLDVASEPQIELSAVLDENAEKREQFILFCFKQQLAFDLSLHEGPGLVDWQRAAYEAHQLAKRDPTSVNKNISRALWLMVRYHQESVSLAFETAADPTITKEWDRMGIPRPEVEQ